MNLYHTLLSKQLKKLLIMTIFNILNSSFLYLVIHCSNISLIFSFMKVVLSVDMLLPYEICKEILLYLETILILLLRKNILEIK